jgi:NAD-dependent dihydropyrimidine dehydrogenase PreA subunit|tara:strand:- start:418 stop:645 length:228 start_codon:yes stop_codon:yes gene_type:complete
MKHTTIWKIKEWDWGCDHDKCTGCNICAEVCPMGVWEMEKRNKKLKAVGMNYKECMDCWSCLAMCPEGAVLAIYE